MQLITNGNNIQLTKTMLVKKKLYVQETFQYISTFNTNKSLVFGFAQQFILTLTISTQIKNKTIMLPLKKQK